MTVIRVDSEFRGGRCHGMFGDVFALVVIMMKRETRRIAVAIQVLERGHVMRKPLGKHQIINAK
jgi:hypothetical protein